MKTVYFDWVPFFQAICHKILGFANDTNDREKKLLELAEIPY